MNHEQNKKGDSIMGKTNEDRETRRFRPFFSFDSITALVTCLVMTGTFVWGMFSFYGNFTRWQQKIDMENTECRHNIESMQAAILDLGHRTSQLESRTSVLPHSQREKE